MKKHLQSALKEEVFSRYQVRKSKEQKTAFIDFVREYCDKRGVPCSVETHKGLMKSRNIIAGDLKKAHIVCTAHYDTCSLLPFPNFITPQNWFLFLLYQLLLCIVIFAVVIAASLLAAFFSDNPLIVAFVPMAAMLLCCIQLTVGYPNRHTANDNTSGVVTLLSIIGALPEESREKVAFVFFDNEELGLIGSACFRRKHGDVRSEKLILNFDCVSDGGNLLFICPKKVRKAAYYQKLRQCLSDTVDEYGKTAVFAPSSSTLYPSDQSGFAYGIGVAAMRRSRFIGLYISRIHTRRDVVFEDDNIDCLTESLLRYAADL